MRSWLLLVTLLAAALSQTPNEIRVMTCCKNTIRFYPGFIDNKTHLPYINPKLNYTYTFSGLPDWLVANGSVLSGTPDVEGSQSTAVTVKYKDPKNSSNKGESKFVVIVGSPSPFNYLNSTVGSSPVTFIQDYVYVQPSSGYSFTGIYPELSEKSNSILIEQPSELRVPVAKAAVLSKPQITQTKLLASTTNPVKTQVSTVSPIIYTLTGSTFTLNSPTPAAPAAPTTSLEITLPCMKAQVDLDNSKNRMTALKWQYDSLMENITAKTDALRKAEEDKNDPLAEVKAQEAQLAKVKTRYGNLQKNISAYQAAVDKTKKDIQNITAQREEDIKNKSNQTEKYRQAYKDYVAAEQDLALKGRTLADLNENVTRSQNQLYMNTQAKQYSDNRLERAKVEYQAALQQNMAIQDGIESLQKELKDLESNLTDATADYYKKNNEMLSLRQKSVIPPELAVDPKFDAQITNLTQSLQSSQVKLANALSYETILKQFVWSAQAKLDAAKKSAGASNDSTKSNKTSAALGSKKPNITVDSPEISSMRIQSNSLKSAIRNVQNLIVSQQNSLDTCQAASSPAQLAQAQVAQAQVADPTPTLKLTVTTLKDNPQSGTKPAAANTKPSCPQRDGSVKGAGKVSAIDKGNITIDGKSIQIDDCTEIIPAGTKSDSIKVTDIISYEGANSGGKLVASKLTIS